MSLKEASGGLAFRHFEHSIKIGKAGRGAKQPPRLGFAVVKVPVCQKLDPVLAPQGVKAPGIAKVINSYVKRDEIGQPVA
mgnify:FL=1